MKQLFHRNNDLDYIPEKKATAEEVKERPLEEILAQAGDTEDMLAKWDRQIQRKKTVPEKPVNPIVPVP